MLRKYVAINELRQTRGGSAAAPPLRCSRPLAPLHPLHSFSITGTDLLPVPRQRQLLGAVRQRAAHRRPGCIAARAHPRVVQEDGARLHPHVA